MFENQIRQARDFITRHERAIRSGEWNNVPASAKVSTEEGQTWLDETTRLIDEVFGTHSQEAARWHELLQKRRDAYTRHVQERQGPATLESSLEYHIHNYLNYVGLLSQFDTLIEARKKPLAQGQSDQPSAPARVSPDKTKTDKAIDWVKNQRVFVAFLLFGAMVIAVANFTDALTKIGNFIGIGARLAPTVREDTVSALIPFNDDRGDPIPEYTMSTEEAEGKNFPNVALFYARIAKWAKAALEDRQRPRSPDEINGFLKELVRYHVFDWVDQLQRDRFGLSMDGRTGMTSSVMPANAPPDFVEYPRERVLEILSKTALSRIPNEMEHWRTGQQFRVPAGSSLRFATVAENGANAYLIEISNPSVYTLTFSVAQGATLNNYGFMPRQFTVTPDALKNIRTFQTVVKGRLVFRQRSDPEKRDEHRYVKWAEGLFSELRRSMEPVKSS